MKHLIHLIVYSNFVFGFVGIMPASANSIITTCNFTGIGSISEAINTLNESAMGGSIFYETPCETIFESRLVIHKDISIFANNLDVVFDGGTITSLFLVDYGASLSLDFINLRNGISQTAGGAIENYGMLLISHGLIESHTAANGGAIYNQGFITIIASFFADNIATDRGGSLFNAGTATIAYSNINENTALNGGGIYNSGTLTLTYTVLSNNSAESAGGALYNTGLQVSANNTFSNNRAVNFGGAIYNESRTMSLAHNTFINHESANGGSLFNGGIVVLTANIFDSGNCASSGMLVDGGYNISNQAGDCLGTILDPELVIDDIGQSFTPANRAIEYALPCVLPIDSDNFERPQGTLCTPGAIEIDDN